MLEPLHKLRVIVEPTEDRVAMDVTWEGHIPAVEEPRQYLRSKGKVVFDTQRLAQTGFWSGTLSAGGNDLAVTPTGAGAPATARGGCARSAKPRVTASARASSVLSGMWNDFPMQFDDHAIMYICHERDDGKRRSSSPSGFGRTRRRASRTSAGPSTNTT